MSLPLLHAAQMPSFLAKPIDFFNFIAITTENRVHDALARIGRKTKKDPQLVYLAIDNASIKLDQFSNEEILGSVSLTRMSMGWPWPRDVYANILEQLFAWGARTVALDLLFLTYTPEDVVLKHILDQHADSVVVGANFVKSYQSMGGVTRAVTSLDIPYGSLIERKIPLDSRIAFVNFYPDVDNVIRYADYFESFGSNENGADTTGAGIHSHEIPSLAAAVLKQLGEADRLKKETSAQKIRFTGPMGTYPTISVAQLFDPKNTGPLFQNGAFFKDKIVIIGPYGNWSQDEHLTPMGLMPGPEIHLNAIAAARQKEWIRETGPLANQLIILFAGVLAFTLSTRFKKISLRLIAIVGVIALFSAATILLFNYVNLYIIWFIPSAVFFLSAVGCLSYEFMIERLEKQKVRSTLERYVSENVVRQILDHEETYQASLGGVRKPVAILFSDIRGFTSLTEKADSQELVLQLNEYLTEMVECVFAQNGTLDKFIGDSVMAIWGNTLSHGAREDALSAARSAWRMQERLAELNAKWHANGKVPFRVGIGINYGEAIVGNMGSPRRMEFTVIGDSVNLASRIEGLTKNYSYDILVGESMASLIQDEFELKEVGDVAVRGKEKPIKVYALVAIRQKDRNSIQLSS